MASQISALSLRSGRNGWQWQVAPSHSSYEVTNFLELFAVQSLSLLQPIKIFCRSAAGFRLRCGVAHRHAQRVDTSTASRIHLRSLNQ
jgi:hypothetical protein